MQNRAFLPTRLRNKKCCLSVGWGIMRRKLMNKDSMKVDYDELDEIRERLLTDPSYNDIEIVSTSLEEFLESIQKPGVKFTTRGGIEELKRRVEREKKEKNNKKER